jgi:hypothetical protein
LDGLSFGCCAWRIPARGLQPSVKLPLGKNGKTEAIVKKTAKPKTKKPELVEPDADFAPVVKAFAANRQVSGGKMMATYGLKVNGKIFAMSWKGKLVAKLPKARVDELVSARKGVHFDPGHGRLMKEWIVIGVGKADWTELAQEACDFVTQGQRKGAPIVRSGRRTK